MTKIAKSVAAFGLGALTVVSGLTAACGNGGEVNSAANPMAVGSSATSGPTGTLSASETLTTKATPARPASQTPLPRSAKNGTRATSTGLPTVPYTYGELLLKAWAKGDRKAAARYAAPQAVSALFHHKPIASLVNYECSDEKPVRCGWIGAGDARVTLGLDQARLKKGARQAVISAQVTKA